MQVNRYLGIFVFIMALSLATAQRRTEIPELDSLPLRDWEVKNPPLSYSKTILMSLFIPGGAQLYGKHYVRAGFLIGLEGGLFLDALWGKRFVLHAKSKQAQEALDSASLYFDSLYYNPDQADYYSKLQSFKATGLRLLDIKKKQQDLQRSELAWALGLHFYGLMDGLEIARASHGHSQKSLTMSGALWRALLLPGAGQLYNGRYGKFGMLWMALGSSTASIFFRQEMVDYFQNRLKNAKQEENNQELSQLEQDITFYRKSRNQYFWGITLLYLYSIGDAVVDAVLNDFDAPQHYALLPGKEPISLMFLYHF